MADPASPASVEDLWVVDPDGFVVARTALAKQLRAAGQRQEATEVAALRKPPRSAWALNVTARDHPDLVAEVLDAADAVRAAAVSGGAALRAAMAASRQAAQALVDASSSLPGAGAEQWRSRMRATVTAAGSDPEVAERLRNGSLQQDHTPAAVDALTALGALAPERPDRPRPDATASTARRSTGARERRPGDDPAVAAADRRAAAQTRELEQRRAEVARLEREVAALDADASRAAERAAAAAGAAQDAHRRLEEAQQALDTLERGG